MLKKTKSKKLYPFRVEIDREEDKRWIAEIPNIPGAMAYGNTRQEAVQKAYAIALRTVADNIEQGGRLTIASRLLKYAMAYR